MVAVVKTFNYTGTLQQATIPAGTTSMDVHLWGGAGGGGGSDAGGPGGTGAAGHYVTSSTISISSAQIGTTLEVAVGGGGAGGSSGGGAPGRRAGDGALPTVDQGSPGGSRRSTRERCCRRLAWFGTRDVRYAGTRVRLSNALRRCAGQ